MHTLARCLHFTLFFCLFFGCSNALGQISPDSTRTVEREIERFLENIDPDDDQRSPEELTQFLIDLANNPVNINTASLYDLVPIPGLNIRLIQNIIDYRKAKPFETVDELVRVNGISPALLDRLRPYVTVGGGYELTKQLLSSQGYWTQSGRFEVFSRLQTILEQQEGYTEPMFEGQSRYAGNQIRYYQRFNYRSKRITLNLTQHKQPGEPLSGPTDFDFNSWHIGIQNIGYLQRLVVGDYGIWAGQGLVLWTGLGFGKGREVIRAPARRERGLQPYQSSEETRFMRGIAATVGNQLQLTGFYSNRPLSATVIQGDSIRFPSSTGFHRTQTERDRRFNTNLEMYGGRIRYHTNFGIVGATAYKAEYDKTIVKGTTLSNLYDFEGSSNSAIGADYRLFFGPLIIYGEAARSQNGGIGLITGSEFLLENNTILSIVYRNYAKDFQSIFGSGFGESSGMPRNEEGIYIALEHQLNRIFQFSGYFDQFRFPAPRFGTRQATSGYDWLTAVDIRLSGVLRASVIARSKIRENDYLSQDSFGRDITIMGQDARTSIRTQLDYDINRKLRTRSRVEWVRARDRNSKPEFGILMFQDIRWLPTTRLMVDARIAFFETQSFTSRIFAFENDMLYVFSSAALAGIGQRGYILLRYSASKNIDIWVKYAATIYEDRQRVGSGLDESIGSKRSQLGFQLRLRF